MNTNKPKRKPSRRGRGPYAALLLAPVPARAAATVPAPALAAGINK